MINKGQKFLLWILMIIFIISLNIVPVKGAEVNRIGGQTRIETACYIGERVFEKADTIILVNGWGYADAVSATPLSKKLDAPILLTKNEGTLEREVKDTIKQLECKKVVIVGGIGVVSEKIEEELEKEYQVNRIAGVEDTTRMGTNAKVAEAVLEGSNVKGAILVNGQDGYADALSVASIAAIKGYPVLFSKSNEVAKVIKDIIEEKGLNILAVGGVGVLKDEVVKSFNGDRVASGIDRFDTNLKVLNYFNDIDFKDIYIAAGGQAGSLGINQFADALVASSGAAKTYGALVLSGLGASSNHIFNAKEYIKNNIKEDTNLIIVGGEGSVSKDIEEDIKNIDREENLDLSEIKKVEGITKVVDFKAYGKKDLEFKINGFKVTLEDLDKFGYEAEFQATKDVFYGKSISKFGTLDKDYLKQIYEEDNMESEDFSYKIVIIKNKNIVLESSFVDVNVIKGDVTGSNIKEYSLKLINNKESFKINSKKLIEGETGEIYDVKGDTIDGRKDVIITDYVTVETSNPFVLEVSGKKIIALSKGEAVITIKSGISEMKFTLTVLENNEQNRRKLTNVEPESSKVELARGGYKNFQLILKDQYGDPFVGEEDKDFFIDKEVKDYKDDLLATSIVINREIEEQKSKVNIKITALELNFGEGDLSIYKAQGAKILQIPIKINPDILFDHVKLEPKDLNSEDLILDINPEKAYKDFNDVVKLQLNEYTEQNSFIRASEGNSSELQSNDGNHIFSLDISSGIKKIPYKIKVDKGVIYINLNREDMSLIEEGILTVEVKEKGMTKDVKRITVKDSSPKINTLELKEGVESNSETLPIDLIIDENNITFEGFGGDGKVRISEKGIIYINTNIDKEEDRENYHYNYDIYLGKLVGSKKEGNIVFNGILDNKFSFGQVNNELDGTIVIGVIKAYSSTPFKTVEIKVRTS